MPIRVTCLRCQSASDAPDEFTGKRVRCRKCGASVDIPEVVDPLDFLGGEPSDLPTIVTEDEPEPESVFRAAMAPRTDPVASSPPPSVDLGTELARLRRQLRWTQRWSVAAGLLLLALIGRGAIEKRTDVVAEDADYVSHSKSIATPSIVTGELTIMDRAGNKKITLKHGSWLGGTQPMITLFGTNGSQVELGFIDKTFDAPRLTFTEPGSNERIGLYSMVGGAAGIGITDAEKCSISLNQFGDFASITLKGSNRLQGHAGIHMSGNGFPAMQLMDVNGKQLLNVPPLPR